MLTVAMSFSMLFACGIFSSSTTEAAAPTETNYESFSITEGVQVKLNTKASPTVIKNAIRFTTTLNATEIEDAIQNYDVKVITIIAKTESLSALGENAFTKANLDAYNNSQEEAGQSGGKIKYQQVVFAEGVNMPEVNSSGDYVFKACLYDIKDENFTQELSAVSYIEIDGVATQYTEKIAKGSLWNTADKYKSDLEKQYGIEGVLTSGDKDYYDYASSLCQTYDVTIENATGTPYVKTVKHGEKLSQYFNTEFGKYVVKEENVAYPSAYVDEDGVDCSNAIITKDIGLTARYEEEGTIKTDSNLVTGVGSQFFNYTTEVYIPDNLGVDTIDKQAFLNARSLTKITMPESVTTIGHEAFFGCTSLETVIMPGVEKITVNEGYEKDENEVLSCRQFMNCFALKTIIVGESFELDYVEVKDANGNSSTGDHRCFYVEGAGAKPNQVNIYLTSADGTVTLHAENNNVQNMLSVNRVYNLNSTEEDVCGMWRWVDGEPILSANSSHNYEGNVCLNCGTERGTAGLTYELSSDRESYYVSAYNGSDTEVLVPSKYFGLPVVAIGENVFNANTRITKVVMPSVTKIGHSAFYGCTSLQMVIMPGVTEIISTDTEYEHFKECVNLSVIVVGGNFKVGTTSISSQQKRVFYHDWGGETANGVTKIYLSSSNGTVDVANYSTHNKLLDLTPYHLNSTEKDICGMWMWDGDEPKLSNYASHNYINGVCKHCGTENPTVGLQYTLNSDETGYVVSGYSGSATEVIIPSTYEGLPVTGIGEAAFVNKSSITKVVMPKSVTTIGKEAFYQCTSLETVIMPGVEYIGVNAGGVTLCRQFYGCTSLKTVVVGESFTLELVTDKGAGDNRCFYTTGTTGQVGIYLTSEAGAVSLYGVGSTSTNNMLSEDKIYYQSKTRPVEESKLATTWTYVDGVPTLWSNIPEAE